MWWAVYCVVGRCTVCYGGVMCVRAVYWVVGRCIVCLGGVPQHMVHHPNAHYTAHYTT